MKCPYDPKIICAYLDPEIKPNYYPCSDCSNYPYQPDTSESVKLECKSVLKAGALIFAIIGIGYAVLWFMSKFIHMLRQ